MSFREIGISRPESAERRVVGRSRELRAASVYVLRTCSRSSRNASAPDGRSAGSTEKAREKIDAVASGGPGRRSARRIQLPRAAVRRKSYEFVSVNGQLPAN